MSFLDKLVGKLKKTEGDKSGLPSEGNPSTKEGSGSPSARPSDTDGSGDNAKAETGFDDDSFDLSNLSDLLAENVDDEPLMNLNSSEQSEEQSKAIGELDEKISKLDASIQTTRSELDGMRKVFDETEQNIKKLLAAYEIVQEHINPFVNARQAGMAAGSGTDSSAGSDDADNDLPFDINSLENEFGLSNDAPLSDMSEDDISIEDLPMGISDDIELEGTEGVEGAETEQTQDPHDEQMDSENDQTMQDTDAIGDEVYDGILGQQDQPYPPDAQYPPDGECIPYDDGQEWIEQNQNHHNIDSDTDTYTETETGGIYIKEPRGHDGQAAEYMAYNPPQPGSEYGSGRPGPILAHIDMNYHTTVLVLRWIEFMFERVKRDKITLLLDYYKDIGWISDDVKSRVMAYARGEIQDVNLYVDEGDDDGADLISSIPPGGHHVYKKVEDWRLSAEDHLKSLLFIEKIAGRAVDKDRLNALEQEIVKFKRSLEGYHGV